MFKSNLFASLILASSTVLAPAAFAAAGETIVMSVEGSSGLLKGDSLVKGQQNDMIVDTFTYNVTDATNVGGAGAGKVKVGTFSVTKLLDFTSVELMEAMLRGEALSKVTITLLKADAAGIEAPQMTITLTNARITSITQNGLSADGGSGHSTETVVFSFTKIEEEAGQTGQIKGESVDGGSVSTTWDVQQAKLQ